MINAKEFLLLFFFVWFIRKFKIKNEPIAYRHVSVESANSIRTQTKSPLTEEEEKLVFIWDPLLKNESGLMMV